MSTMEPPKSDGEPEKAAIPTPGVGTPAAGSQHPPPSPLSGCYLLVVLPEPHNAQHKDLIINRIAKGFLSWDKDNCHVDLEKELQALVAQAPEGEEARNGERLIQYATENLVTEILIHPQSNTLLQCIRNLLASFTKHRHIIHAGYTFSENGSWILQDGTFSLADFLDAFNEHDVQRVLRAYENSVTVDINCAAIGEWSVQRLSKEPCTRSCRVRLNPDDVLTAGVPAITSFTNYISQYLVPQALDQLMQPSDVVGNIRFSHPTLYVFPGGQGDAALFGINGFNMLVDGGFARKSCFWDFTRHLDRLDAVLLTRMNNSNVGGMSSVLCKKREMQVYPHIGHFFCNLVERKHSNSPDGDKDLDPLILSLTELGQEMMLNLKHINLRPHPCYREPEPINLYQKVGHGTLDMYVLSPSKDSREVREFLSKWNAGDWKLFAGSHKKDSNNLTFPIQNLVSICALLVWQPANPEDTITRILFPGSTPQHKIFEGIERLRHLEFLKHPRCTAKSISPSASLVALKDKPMKIQKMNLMDRETKRAIEVRKAKREDETKQKIELTQPEKGEEKPKPIPKKKEIVENKKIDSDIKENGVKDVKKIDKELKDIKDAKKMIKDDVKKTEVIKNKPETEKTAVIKEMKPKPERKEKKITKEPIQKISLPKAKAEAAPEKKTKAPTPKKIVNGVSPKPEDKVKAAPAKSAPKTAAKVLPAAAPKSAKDANNRKVVEQKNIERMSMSKAAAKPKATPPTEKKPVPRRPKPSGSPSKAKFVAGSPIKSAKSTPTASVKSDKDGVMRKIKTEKGTADSSTVSTPSAIEIDSMTKFTDKCLTEKSEDMSLDSIESKVLADLKEERQVVEEIEAVLQKAERIEVARKESRIDGEDEVTGDATDKKDITEDMTEDDVTADIDEVPRKTPTRKASQEQLTEEEDEYLIIEKEEGDTEDSVHSGEAEHKHFLDAAQSEKEKILKDEEYEEKEVVDEEELEPEEIEEEDEEEIDEEEDEGEEKEMAVEKGIMEEREKSDDASEKKPHPEVEKTPEKATTPLAEYKEQPEDEMKGIITSATEILQKTEEKDDSGKKDSEDITKEPSSLSPEKLDSSEKKTDTDVKPEVEKTKEKMEESQERISTIESGATTTAPTLPEDERIPVDAAKPSVPEKTVDDKKVEVPQKPKDITPLAAEPSEVKAEVRTFNIRQGPQALQRDIVKTPDEVADLPVHEEVDPKLYKMEDFEKSKDEKAQAPISAPQELKESPSKEQKGVFSFFGKVADKFEKGMDKLTGKGRRDSEKDIDEKSSSKSTSPKGDLCLDAAPTVVSEVQLPKVVEKEREREKETEKEKDSVEPPETVLSTPAPQPSQPEDKTKKIPADSLHKSIEALDDLEDADGVEALLEEASKKFKTVKDSLRDSLESLEEKIVEEEFKRAAELAVSTKDEVKDTLEEVVEKLEEIQPQMHGVVVDEKEPEKVHFVVPADDEDEDEEGDGTDLVRDVKEAVREVGEVLAGTAGILLDEKPKDVIEIVKKVAEVLKEDDFLSEKALFESPAKSPTQKDEIEEVVEKKTSSMLECKEEPCIKKTVEVEPVEDSEKQVADKSDAKAICQDLMKDEVSVQRRKRSLTEQEGIDVMEAGVEEVCQKIEVPERQEKHEPPEIDSKEDRRDSVEIEPAQISLEHKIAPTTAEYVIVTPDSLPASPKFPSEKLQTHLEKEIIASNLPRPGLPKEVQDIIESAKTLDEVIGQLVFAKNEKITIEIIEYIILIRRVPREQIMHVIQEIITKKKVPQNTVVADVKILQPEEQPEVEIKTKISGVDEKEKDTDTKAETPADDSMITDQQRSEIESEILNEYLTKNKKITKNIIEEIHVKRRVPIYVIIEIIEYIIIQKKLQRQSLLDVDDATWEKLKLDYAGDGEEEGKSVEEDQHLEDFIIVPSAGEVENLHRIECEILDNYIGKGKKITRTIVEEIHVTWKIPIYVVLEVIEKIIITKKLQKNSVVEIPEGVWNEMVSDALNEEKLASEKAHDGFEAVEQEYKFSEEKEKIETAGVERGEVLEEDTSDVMEADEKLIDKSSIEKPRLSITDKIKTDTDGKKSPVEIKKAETIVSHEEPEVSAVESEVDDESSSVRRMIVTATSEDGGDETVICPTGSITFGKSITPDDSLKGSPIKTEHDKDSLHSHESTPEKDSISAKDSLDKSPTSVRDSQTLDDSIERSKTEEKKIPEIPAPAVEEKTMKDLHLDQIDKQPSDYDKTEDASPAESVFAESPLKEPMKRDMVDAKPIPDAKPLEQVPPQEEKVDVSVEKEPTLMKETMEKEKIDVVLDKSRSSSIGSLTQEEVTPTAIKTSRRDSTISQEPIIKPDGKDSAHDESIATPITAPSADHPDATIRKESVTAVEKDKIVTDVKAEADETKISSTIVPSDKAVDLKTLDKKMERKSPSPSPDTEKSSVSPDVAATGKDEEKVKESDASPDISLAPKEQTKEEEPEESAVEIDEKSSTIPPISPVASLSPKESLIEEKEKSEEKLSESVEEKVTSPLRRASVASLKDDEVKKSSAPETLDDHESGEKEKNIDGIADSRKSPTPPKEISPIKKGILSEEKDSLDGTIGTTIGVPTITDKLSITSKDNLSLDTTKPPPIMDNGKHGEIKTDTESDHKKSPSPSPTEIKSAQSSRETSPIRKQSLLTEGVDVKADIVADDRKSPASSIGDVRSTKSSREVSPIRTEKLIVESDMKIDEDDKKSPTPRVTDAKSSRDISPVRKESLIADKLDEKVSPSVTSTSPIRRGSISHDGKESLEVAEKFDEKTAPSPAGSISPIHRSSLTVEEKALPSAPLAEHEEKMIDSQKSPTSPGGASPIKNQIVGKLEELSVEPGVGETSPVKSIKSPASPRDKSPSEKETIVPEEKVSASPRLSIDLKSDKKIGDGKSPSPIAPSIKSSTSSGDTSPIRKESLGSDKKLPTSDLEKEGIDSKSGDTKDEKKTPSPTIGSRKSSITPQDTSSISPRRASVDIKDDADAILIPDEKIAIGGTSRLSVDLEPEDVAIDKKSPSPIAEGVSSISPRETSPTRKESLALSEKISASPRVSIDIKPEVGLDGKSVSPVIGSPKLASPRDTSPSREVHTLEEERMSPTSTPVVAADSKLDESHEKAPSPDEKAVVGDTPRASIDIKQHQETIDKKTPSPDEKVTVSETPRESVDIKLEKEIIEKTQRSPEKVCVSETPRASIDKTLSSPDEKISVTQSAPIDIKQEEKPIDKESSSLDDKVAFSGTSSGTLDVKHEEGTSDKKTSSPNEKVSISTPRASVDIKHDEDDDHKISITGISAPSIETKQPEFTDKKVPSPDGVASEAPRASIDIKLEEKITEEPKLEDKVSVTTPIAPMDIKQEKKEEKIIDKESASADDEALVSEQTASVDIKIGGEIAERESLSLHDKVSISGTSSIDIKQEEEPDDKKTPSPDEKVEMNSTARSSIDIKSDETDMKETVSDGKISVSETITVSADTKHSEITEKRTPSPDEKILTSGTPRASVDIKSAEEITVSTISPAALSPVKSISKITDDKGDEKHEKSAVNEIITEKTIIQEITMKLTDGLGNDKINGKESLSPSIVDSKSATSSRGVSPDRKESLKDVKSLASSRDASPIRKETVISEVAGKSPESASIVSPPKKESPAPEVEDTTVILESSTKTTEESRDVELIEKSPESSQVISPIRKTSLTLESEGKTVVSPEVISQKKGDIKMDTQLSPQKSPEPLMKDAIEKDMGIRSRSSSMASEKSTVEPTKDEKVPTKELLHQLDSPVPVDKSPARSPTHSPAQKPTTADKHEEVEFPEAPSRDRSRSHSLFDAGEKTPLGRSRAASLFEDKEDIVKAVSRKSSGLSEFHEDHFQREEAEDDIEISEAKRINIERYIISQYVSRKQKITEAALEEIVALFEVPNYIVIEKIYEICEKMKIPKESIIDDVNVFEKTQLQVSKGLPEANMLLQIPLTTKTKMEDYITQEYIVKKKRITPKILHEISLLKGLDEETILLIIELIIIEREIPRESLIEDDTFVGHSSRKSPAIKEGDEIHQFEGYKGYAGTGGGITQYKEEHKSGKSSPERRSSGYSTPEVRHYDDKYESQFHKAFVGGMTEIRTTHITTLSGKSTPDVGTRIDTPDSLQDTVGSSDKMSHENMEGEPVVIKRTIRTEVPEYETVITKTVVKREIIEEDDDGTPDDKSNIAGGFDEKGVMKVDLSKSLISSSSGRSTPDRIRDLSEGRSSTATPDSLRSHEVIKTTITKTRTLSDEGEIITTTKEVTETTNEHGETVVVEEKVDVKTTPAEPGIDTTHHRLEQRPHEDSEEDSPLSATSQVYHYNEADQKHVEFSTADMSSSFYGQLPDIPPPRHSTETVGDDKDFSFKKFSLEKQVVGGADEHMTTSRQFSDVADYDVDKVLREHEKDQEGDDEDEAKDPIGGWGTPLKLPSPERPDKFNLRSVPIVRSSVDMSPDSLNFDVINDWGEPLRLPSPAPTADEVSNKAMPPTPKKERRQPKKIVAENMKNKKRSDSPANKEKKKESKKVQPVYLDLTYVPHHGNSYYASLEFFKRVRARYYVFSGTEPSREVYDALLDAKKTWENKNLEVTMIPTYDTDTLGYWVADNEEALAANHIDLSPSASRCTINLQDHETSCSAYRLEF
ncbi:microtubule-associated protein futsch [Fopius arisanus]|uniref:Microtubule-associated protein futsch n=1 Tax=Fopius arisanus TaxID=64838 RepID=A0A9R1SXZ8_9HYME|nr:PREDICTED: microtubule-associated protein futsch [Fopius arisanus]XP_011299190.1 PREDICTED: microtubule-associated protein futsch [Fopius arisanus]